MEVASNYLLATAIALIIVRSKVSGVPVFESRFQVLRLLFSTTPSNQHNKSVFITFVGVLLFLHDVKASGKVLDGPLWDPCEPCKMVWVDTIVGLCYSL